MSSVKNRLRRILPLEINFELVNFLEYFKLKNISLSDDTRRPRAIFLDAASYDNLGDQAVTLAISLYLRELFGEEYYFEVSEMDFLRNLHYLKHHVKKADIICLCGGGNMGTFYPRYEAIRRKVIRNFPDNKIAVFPQTIDYETDIYGARELQRFRKIYSAHKHILVCVREEKSLKICLQQSVNCCLVPDIVLTLYSRIKIFQQLQGLIGVCLRRDNESILQSSETTSIYDAIQNLGFEVCSLTTMDVERKTISREIREKRVVDKIHEFSQCKCVITDRLHGMIFSIIARVPCLVIDNSNHKVVGVYKTIENIVNGVVVLNYYSNISDAINDAIGWKVSLDTSRLKYDEIESFMFDSKI